MPSGDASTTFAFPEFEPNGAQRVFDTTGVLRETSVIPGAVNTRAYRTGGITLSGRGFTPFTDIGSIMNRYIGPAWPGDITSISLVEVYLNGEFGVQIGISAGISLFTDDRLTESEFAEAADFWFVFEVAGTTRKYRVGDAAPQGRFPRFRWNQGNIPYPDDMAPFRLALYTGEPYPQVVEGETAITLPLPRITADVSIREAGETAVNFTLPLPRVSMNLQVDDPASLTFPRVDAVQSVSVAYQRKYAKAVSATSQEEAYHDYGSNRFVLTAQMRYRDEAAFRDFKAQLDANGPAAVFALPVGNIPGGFANMGSGGTELVIREPAQAGSRVIEVDRTMGLYRGAVGTTDPVVLPGHVIQSTENGKTYAVQRVDAAAGRIFLSWPLITDLGVGSRFRTGRNAGMLVRLSRDAQPSVRSHANRNIVTSTLQLIEAI